jgi:hypothetical protein
MAIIDQLLQITHQAAAAMPTFNEGLGLGADARPGTSCAL